jgi:ADP-heptose:LPS heptosyltransferase
MNVVEPAILIFRIGSLGDTVVALPCFHLIARSFPNSRRIVVTDSPASQKVTPVESVLGNSGLIHETIYFAPPPRRLPDVLALRRRLRQTGATTLIYVADRNLASTLRDVYFFRACGIRHVIGAPIARRLRRLRTDPATGDTEREAERLARCLAPLGPIDLDDPQMWDLQLQPDELRVADAALAQLQGRHFAALSLGGKDRDKDWGNDNWIALLQHMEARYADLALVFVGSGDEFDRCAGIAAQWRGPTLNLCGRLAPRESAAVMRRAAFYLGHDCGPMHLAAAVGTPCIAVFGPVNMPKWWHPMGSKHRIIHNMQSIRAIMPARVFAAIDATLSEMPRRLGERDVSMTA